MHDGDEVQGAALFRGRKRLLSQRTIPAYLHLESHTHVITRGEGRTELQEGRGNFT